MGISVKNIVVRARLEEGREVTTARWSAILGNRSKKVKKHVSRVHVPERNSWAHSHWLKIEETNVVQGPVTHKIIIDRNRRNPPRSSTWSIIIRFSDS